MNKLSGFYELKKLNLPAVEWRRFEENSVLDESILWTVRCAVEKGNDINLPRAVGVTAKEAREFGLKILKECGGSGLVVYYPYFIAEKSGTLAVSRSSTVIEAVKDDLWNLVTYNKIDVTVLTEDGVTRYFGDGEFLTEEETKELNGYADYIRNVYKNNYLLSGTVLLEWCYAYRSLVNKDKTGQRQLVFIELRGIK